MIRGREGGDFGVLVVGEGTRLQCPSSMACSPPFMLTCVSLRVIDGARH